MKNVNDKCNFKMFTERGFHFQFSFYITKDAERRKTNCTDSYLKIFASPGNNNLLYEHCGSSNDVVAFPRTPRVTLKYKRGNEGLNPSLKILWNIVPNERQKVQDAASCDRNYKWNQGKQPSRFT